MVAVGPSEKARPLSWCLPRIRRSPCGTASAARQRGGKGTAALMEGTRASGAQAVHAAQAPCGRACGATVRMQGDRRGAAPAHASRSRGTGKRRPSAEAQTAADVPAFGRHADQFAFTTCDVTPVDKTMSSEGQYPFARSRRRSGPTSTRRSMWLAWKNRGRVRTCEGLWPLCPAAPAPASTQIVSSTTSDGITVPQVAN